MEDCNDPIHHHLIQRDTLVVSARKRKYITIFHIQWYTGLPGQGDNVVVSTNSHGTISGSRRRGTQQGHGRRRSHGQVRCRRQGRLLLRCRSPQGQSDGVGTLGSSFVLTGRRLQHFLQVQTIGCTAGAALVGSTTSTCTFFRHFQQAKTRTQGFHWQRCGSFGGCGPQSFAARISVYRS